MTQTLIDKAIMIYNDIENRYYVKHNQSIVFDLIYILLKNDYTISFIEYVIAIQYDKK